MKPAFSVVFLTTLIGVGQGLFLALYTGQLYAFFDLLPAQDSQSFYAVGSASGAGISLRRIDRLVFPSRPSGTCVAYCDAMAHLMAVARGDRAARIHGNSFALWWRTLVWLAHAFV